MTTPDRDFPAYEFMAPMLIPDFALTEAEDLGTWVEVTGGSLPMPIQIRVTRGPAGKLIVNGLRVGEDGTTAITSETLRSIRLPHIIQNLTMIKPSGSPEKPESANWSNDELEAWRDEVLHYIRFEGFMETIPDDPAVQKSYAEAAEFAEVYLRELARDSYRAMTTTANHFHISRSTANRRAAKCRELGLLPRLESEQS